MSACSATATMPMPIALDSEPADNDLVRQAKAGNTRCFELLYRRHNARIHGVVLRLVGYDQARAEDIVQEAFVQAWRKLADFRQQSAFGTWLYRLAVNCALMNLRAGKSDPLRKAAELLPEEDGRTPFCPAERAALETAIAALPTRARAVLVLHDVEGWRHQDISAELDMAVGTSKAQLHRARQLLRRSLQHEGRES